MAMMKMDSILKHFFVLLFLHWAHYGLTSVFNKSFQHVFVVVAVVLSSGRSFMKLKTSQCNVKQRHLITCFFTQNLLAYWSQLVGQQFSSVQMFSTRFCSNSKQIGNITG